MSQQSVLDALKKKKEMTIFELMDNLKISRSTISSNTKRLLNQKEVRVIKRRDPKDNKLRYFYSLNTHNYNKTKKTSQNGLKRKNKAIKTQPLWYQNIIK
jgi:DNA-binding MarR family transcriptional regulator